MITDEELEIACKAMYGKGWDGPIDCRPADKTKSYWKEYARKAIEAVDEHRRKMVIRQQNAKSK